MICPHCNYEDTTYVEPSETTNGGDVESEKGKFFESSFNVLIRKRSVDIMRFIVDHKSIYGCPNCFKVFINQ